MARPVSVSPERILEAARAVFSERGFGATTAEIARRARVSQGSLFNHFKDKVSLFVAALDLPTPDFLDRIPEMVGRGEVRSNVEDITRAGLTFVQRALPRVVTLLSHRNLLPAGRFLGEDAPPVRFIALLASYLRAEAKIGRLAVKDADMAARMLVGSIWHYALFQRFMGDGEGLIPAQEAFVTRLVAQAFEGLAAPRPAARRRANS